jgi:hypothetical protein
MTFFKRKSSNHEYLFDIQIIYISEATTELNNLVEDKEIASKAVAFVVNSTRKGIVPLCANVANLLRAKYRLVWSNVKLS